MHFPFKKCNKQKNGTQYLNTKFSKFWMSVKYFDSTCLVGKIDSGTPNNTYLCNGR